MHTLTSRQIAARRGVGTLPTLTRDRTGAPLDLSLDLDRATPEQLEAHRHVLLARLRNPQPGDDLNALTERAQLLSDRIAAVHDAERRRAALLSGGQVGHVGNGQPESGDSLGDLHGRTFAPLGTAPAAFVPGAVRAWEQRGGGKISVPVDVRALFTTGSAFTQPERLPGIVTPATPRNLLDVIATRPVNNSRFEFLRDISPDSAAAEVAEGTLKPESSVELEPVSEDIKTIATWVQETRQALQDDPQAAAWVEQRLVDGVRRRLARQVLVGDGAGPNLRGILNRAGLGTYVGAAGEPAAVVVRKAQTIAEQSGATATAYVVNPATAELLDLDTGGDDHWRGLPPSVTLTRIVDPAMPAGQVLVGDLSGGSVALLVRDGGSVYVTDSHGSTFTSNILTILAEGRWGLALFRPSALAVGTITPAA